MTRFALNLLLFPILAVWLVAILLVDKAGDVRALTGKVWRDAERI